ncbi:MAG: metallophosphoesterase [Oligoflexia bacterium]|nr:metallophosphoesterase [Oligoflexia bacterium]
MLFVLLLASLLTFNAIAANTGVIEITQPQNYTRVVAVSDIHGSIRRLRELLINSNLINDADKWTGGRTLFIVTGDSIDKGHNSIGVLDLWMKLEPQIAQAGGKFIHVLGNHEAEFLADPMNYKADELRAELKEKGIKLKELTDENFPRGKFIRSMPLAARVGKWLFCHSGHYPKMTWAAFKTKAQQVLSSGDYSNEFLIGENSILTDKEWWKYNSQLKEVKAVLNKNGIFGVVFGHDPNAFRTPSEIQAVEGYTFIKIDVGINRVAGGNPGRLLIFPEPSQLNEMVAPTVLSMDELGKAYKVK